MESGKSTAWSLFLTAHAVLIAAIEQRLSQANMPGLDWYDALWALERAPDQRLRMFEFEHWMVISRSNITRLIDRLEQAGLVMRERSDEDRRGAYAVLTNEGRKLRKKMWAVYEEAIETLFNAHLSAAQARQIEGIFRALVLSNEAPPAVAQAARQRR